MSACRNQALIKASPGEVWELVGNPGRHPEWWPRVVEVRGERFDEGSNYAQVTKRPIGRIETTWNIEHRDDLREISMHCRTTGTYARWLLTEAQGNTFVDVEFGMDPIGLSNRIFDRTFGRLYFRRWLEQSLAGLEQAAQGTSQPDQGSSVNSGP